MSISPIGPQVYTKAHTNNIQKPASTAANTDNGSKPELLIGVQFDENKGTARISTSLKNCFDSNMWYTIHKDGSGESIGAWGRGVKYPAGTFNETYNSIEEACKDGRKPDDKTLKAILETYKKAEDNAMENYNVSPIDLRV